MAKRLLLAATAVLFLISCSPEKFRATIPAYISIDEIEVRTDYDTEGTAHSKITTVWIFADNEFIGAFELPCTVPVIAEGNTAIRIRPGITMNGVSSSRALYTPYQPLDTTINLTPADTFHYLNPDMGTPTVGYHEFSTIEVIEDFDLSGLNLSANFRSDTNIYKSADSADIFIHPTIPENNGKAGVIAVDLERTGFELETIESYDLPKSGESVYLELTYKNDIPFVLGVVANSGSSSSFIPTLVIFPTDTYNKIYINLVNEINYIQGTNSFGIFVRGQLPDDKSIGKVYLDNLKIVY